MDTFGDMASKNVASEDVVENEEDVAETPSGQIEAAESRSMKRKATGEILTGDNDNENDEDKENASQHALRQMPGITAGSHQHDEEDEEDEDDEDEVNKAGEILTKVGDSENDEDDEDDKETASHTSPQPARSRLYQKRSDEEEEEDEEDEEDEEVGQRILDADGDHYAVLGITPEGVTDEIIRGAYDKIEAALETLPSHLREPGRLNDIKQALTNALDALGTKEARDQYDIELEEAKEDAEDAEMVRATLRSHATT